MMTVKLIAIYRNPPDIPAFNSRYDRVRTPLVEQIPDLQPLMCAGR